MGIKGLYSYVKRYSHIVRLESIGPCRIGVDAYAVLYRFPNDLSGCTQFLDGLLSRGHQITMYMEGAPPQEKWGELLERREQKHHASLKAEALKLFLDKEQSLELSEKDKDYLRKQIHVLERESWRIDRTCLEAFRQICDSRNIPIRNCASEADFDLIQAARKGEIDRVISNDMDLFVGGVPCLWMLGKTPQDPLLREFRFQDITQECGIHPRAWADVAILAGYEKAKKLKRCGVEQAITWIRYYGCLENLLVRQKELLGEATLADFQAARKWLQV